MKKRTLSESEISEKIFKKKYDKLNTMIIEKGYHSSGKLTDKGTDRFKSLVHETLVKELNVSASNASNLTEQINMSKMFVSLYEKWYKDNYGYQKPTSSKSKNEVALISSLFNTKESINEAKVEKNYQSVKVNIPCIIEANDYHSVDTNSFLHNSLKVIFGNFIKMEELGLHGDSYLGIVYFKKDDKYKALIDSLKE